MNQKKWASLALIQVSDETLTMTAQYCTVASGSPHVHRTNLRDQSRAYKPAVSSLLRNESRSPQLLINRAMALRLLRPTHHTTEVGDICNSLGNPKQDKHSLPQASFPESDFWGRSTVICFQGVLPHERKESTSVVPVYQSAAGIGGYRRVPEGIGGYRILIYWY